MTKISCGIDFGTSNSSIAVADDNNRVRLVPVEDGSTTIPSAIFFPRNEPGVFYGRQAVRLFFQREEGRFMRSLKRVLGTPLMKLGTAVNGKPLKFERIISPFLKQLKEKAEHEAGKPIDNVVMGRPVHFVDNNGEADSQAQTELKSMAQEIGFRNIEFQFEPIAAAFAHEMKITGEKLAIVADLGGGTSDFTVIRLSNRLIDNPDRSSDILANTGVRIGGNDFDKNLCLSLVMPELGYQSTYGEKHLEVPLKYFHDLSEWSKINFLYTPKNLSHARQLLHQSHDRLRFKRFLNVLERETGHKLLASVEETKIALTSHEEYKAEFEFIENDFSVMIGREQFETVIRDEVQEIAHSAMACLQQAMVKPEAIELVILTGGSTEVPVVQRIFRELFPKAVLSDENKMTSVGLGLAYDSRNKFR